jgi:indolepyruvate ferredoxin oxidoreductase, beta subunit
VSPEARGGRAGRGNIFLAGVGGQGTLLASEVLCGAFLLEGYDVKKSEVHGMAQRGGAVTTHVRYGPKVHSPLIEPGTADLLVAFEKMEALRFLHYLREGGTVVANAQEIHPPPVATGQARYPERVAERLRAVTPRVFLVDALAAALSLHEVRAVNVVMLGAASHALPLGEEAYVEALRAGLPERIREVNLMAFRAGRALVAPAGAAAPVLPRGGARKRASGGRG